jgi:hypothetical protein
MPFAAVTAATVRRQSSNAEDASVKSGDAASVLTVDDDLEMTFNHFKQPVALPQVILFDVCKCKCLKDRNTWLESLEYTLYFTWSAYESRNHMRHGHIFGD